MPACLCFKSDGWQPSIAPQTGHRRFLGDVAPGQYTTIISGKNGDRRRKRDPRTA
jgi:hypothetical protein